METIVARDINNFVLPMDEVRATRFVLGGAGPDVAATALIRRKDLAGAGSVQSLKLRAQTAVPLLPGRWEAEINPPRGYYVSGFGGPRNSLSRPDGWDEIQVSSSAFVSVTLSDGPAALHGVVRESGKTAAAAPVFIEGWDPTTRNRLVDLRETRTDMSGNYRFDSLAPGEYRVLSTFDYASPTPQVFDALGAREASLEKATDLALDLDLSGIR